MESVCFILVINHDLRLGIQGLGCEAWLTPWDRKDEILEVDFPGNDRHHLQQHIRRSLCLHSRAESPGNQRAVTGRVE